MSVCPVHIGQLNWNDVKALTLLFLNETHFFNFCRYPLNRHFLYSHLKPFPSLAQWSWQTRHSAPPTYGLRPLPRATPTTQGHSWCFVFVGTWQTDWCKEITQMSHNLFWRMKGLHKETWNFEGGMFGPLRVVVIWALWCSPGWKFEKAKKMKGSLIG